MSFAFALSHFTAPYHLILRKSSVSQISPMLKNQKRRIYVSCLLKRVLLINHWSLRTKDIPIIRSITIKKIPPHIVGVHCLCSWS